MTSKYLSSQWYSHKISTGHLPFVRSPAGSPGVPQIWFTHKALYSSDSSEAQSATSHQWNLLPLTEEVVQGQDMTPFRPLRPMRLNLGNSASALRELNFLSSAGREPGHTQPRELVTAPCSAARLHRKTLSTEAGLLGANSQTWSDGRFLAHAFFNPTADHESELWDHLKFCCGFSWDFQGKTSK